MRSMLFRETPCATIAVPQPGHAWLSGQIIRAWGNSRFGSVTPYEEVCLAAEQHDIGWLAWEEQPTLNVRTGRPHSFRELDVAAHTAIWRRGAVMALAMGRYPALLISLHGTGLYANFDAASASEADRALVRHFLDEQCALQRRLVDSLSRDRRLGRFSGREAIERNRGLVRAADRMSVAICTGLRDVAIGCDNPNESIVKDVPAADCTTDIWLQAVDAGVTTIAVSPWPFSAATVGLVCEAILLPSRSFYDEGDMRSTLRAAERATMAVELKPA
jgi:hypothetical protein